jgi:hypothetical protein
LIIVDDASGKPTSYFLKLKSVAKGIIKTFIEGVNTNNLTKEKRVQRFHLNSGGEFLSKKLEQFFIKQGIKQTWTALNTLEHNGVAERMIQSVVSMTRCMLITYCLPLLFWTEECVMHIKYILYLLPK